MEANKYLGVTQEDSDNMRSRVAPTPYAIKRGAWTNSDYETTESMVAGRWWLRSSGNGQFTAAYVRTDGSLYYYNVNYGSGCVRPALWINLKLDIF